MFWKNRNTVGILILLVATFLWTWGREMVFVPHIVYETTSVMVETTYKAFGAYTEFAEDSTSSSITDAPVKNIYIEVESKTGRQAWGIALCVLAVLVALMGIFVFSQKKTILGPDGLCAFWFLGSWGYGYVLYVVGEFLPNRIVRFVFVFLLLLTVRILWGWCLCRFSSEQCILRRLANRFSGESKVLLLFIGWVILSVVALGIYCFTYAYLRHWVIYGAGLGTLAFGIYFLWNYIMELRHFEKQLENYSQGSPIEVKQGAFAQTEQQLLRIREEHHQAVETAVIGERFKVDLITNVSHDLRTPLTSIIGYSELLEKEALSPKGREQLERLREKSVYMNELVESLFELTKVESGAVEPKKERIDLIRLLEQTIGFLDDRLQEAAPEIRRQYSVESLFVLSDGRMLHQILVNLLGNALKYAMPSTRIYLEAKEEADQAVIRVVNTANYEMDFSEEEILQRFARGDKARTTRGSGVGLAIAQTYTEALGGTFRIKVDGDQFSAMVSLLKSERDS